MDFLTDPFLVSKDRFDGSVLVTGAGGCIGAWVVSILTRSGVRCLATDVLDNRARPALILGEDASHALDWATCDVTDGTAVRSLVN